MEPHLLGDFTRNLIRDGNPLTSKYVPYSLDWIRNPSLTDFCAREICHFRILAEVRAQQTHGNRCNQGWKLVYKEI